VTNRGSVTLVAEALDDLLALEVEAETVGASGKRDLAIFGFIYK